MAVFELKNYYSQKLYVKAKILRSIFLPNIPSASGIEIINDEIYIIGDDSQFLFHIDKDGNVIDKLPLTNNATDIRIAKSDKPDYEAISFVNINNEDFLLVIGSGSLQIKRENAKLINLNTKEIHSIVLSEIYTLFKNTMTIEDQRAFNIEGLSSDNTYLYFAQRGNITGHQMIFKLKIDEFFHFCNDKITIPKITTYTFNLPSVKGVSFGISGCCFDNESKQMLFCASAETTHNTYDDGDILGSIIGVIDLQKDIDKNMNIIMLHEKCKAYTQKIESLSILRKESITNYILLAVCDNDDGSSILLEIQVNR